MTTNTPKRRMSNLISSSPSTLPLDVTVPVRIVQKQVIQICGNKKGCSAVLFMRLALPTSSRKRSYSLFPEEEGVKLKSTAVYPISLDKNGKIILPKDAGPALKRASRILTVGSNAEESSLTSNLTEHSNKEDSESESSSKLVKPRITISNFQITIVSSQTSEEQINPAFDKQHYLAVIQIDVGLRKSPPTWPFEAHIPIPRCLNNKLHFTQDDQDADKNQHIVVEFNPPLVQRSASRSTESSSSLDKDLEADDSFGMIEDGPSTAVSGPFPATNILVVRWAQAHAAKDADQHVHSRSSFHSVRARSLFSDGQVLSVEKVDEEYADIALRFHVTLQESSYPGLEPISELELSLSSSSEFHWLNETLSIRSERSKTLHSWRTDGKEVLTLSRSSSVSMNEPSSVDTDDSTVTTETTAEPFSTVDEFASLIDIQPPKEVIEPLQDDTSFDGTVNPVSLAPSSFLTPKRIRKVSISSHKSLASEYSQRSANSDGHSLHLFLRTTAIRDASAKGEDIAFYIDGKVRTRISRFESDGTLKAPCPLLLAARLNSYASISSINDEIELAGDTKDTNRKSLIFEFDGSNTVNRSVDLTKRPKLESANGTLDETSADYSHSTIGFANGRSHHHNSRRKSLYHTVEEKFDELGLHTIVGEETDNATKQLGDWSGIIEDIKTSVWIMHGTTSASFLRKAVYRIQVSWPYALSIVSTPAQAEFFEKRVPLLPRLVLALQRASVEEKIDLLHVSVQGKPVQVNCESREISEKAIENGTMPSKMVDIRLPEYVQGNSGQVIATLIYSVEGPSSASMNLFAPVASTVTYFHSYVHGEIIQDFVPSLAYSSEPLSSSVQCDEKQSTITIEASMLPSMTSITMDFVKRTKPLVPLSPPPTAPLRRQSFVSNTSTGAVGASLLPSIIKPESKERSVTAFSNHDGQNVQIKQQGYRQESSSHNLITWSTFHAFLLVLMACSLYNVNFSVIPSVQQISRKVDVMGLALNLDFTNDGQYLHSYSEHSSGLKDESPSTNSNPSLNNQLALQHPHANSLAIPNTDSLSDFFTWLSLALSWPMRRLFSIFVNDDR